MNQQWPFLDVIIAISIIFVTLTLFLRFKVDSKLSEKLPNINWVRFFALNAVLALFANFLLFTLNPDLSPTPQPVHSVTIIGSTIQDLDAALEVYEEERAAQELKRNNANAETSFAQVILQCCSPTLFYFFLLSSLVALLLMALDGAQTARYKVTLVLFMISPGFSLLFPNVLHNMDEFISFSVGRTSPPLPIASTFINSIYFFFLTYTLLNYIAQVYALYIEEKRYEKELLINTQGIDKAFKIAAFTIALLTTLILSGADIQSISLITAAVTIGISIALKDVLENFMAGVLLMWDDSIKKDNVISVENYITGEGETTFGWIDRITMRYTVIKDRNDINILVPNSALMSNPIINWTQDGNKVRIKLDLDISYASNVEMAITILKGACVKEERILHDPPPSVNVMNFGESAIELQLRFFIADAKAGIRNIKSAIYKTILREISNNDNIDIPVPQRDVLVVKPKRYGKGSSARLTSALQGHFDKMRGNLNDDNRESIKAELVEYMKPIQDQYGMNEQVFKLYVDDCVSRYSFLDPSLWTLHKVEKMSELSSDLQKMVFEQAFLQMIAPQQGDS